MPSNGMLNQSNPRLESKLAARFKVAGRRTEADAHRLDFCRRNNPPPPPSHVSTSNSFLPECSCEQLPGDDRLKLGNSSEERQKRFPPLLDVGSDPPIRVIRNVAAAAALINVDAVDDVDDDDVFFLLFPVLDDDDDAFFNACCCKLDKLRFACGCGGGNGDGGVCDEWRFIINGAEIRSHCMAASRCHGKRGSSKPPGALRSNAEQYGSFTK
ncbi:hypothetical protein BLOT_012909 [Blomia tropicalis]|nr:hypothetical protein BLOT_012909 [Blomia tropicalis]